MTTTPDAVEPGQVWRDRDQRSVGAGEFVILAVVTKGRATYADLSDRLRPRVEAANDRLSRLDWPRHAIVHRRATDRVVTIRLDRLEDGRDYELIGAGR